VHYRPDIDGLRAVAILPVVLYHAGVPGFPGGFVGVDVFFVISGYLITSLIQPEIAAHSFSLARFYERRIRRIFPALFAVVFASFAAGVFLLLPADLAALGRSAGATALFVSNFLFWRESGYFSAPAELAPLLHTWSLAIEEQFYVVFPVLLLLANRFFGRHLVAGVAAAGVLSFALCVACTAMQPETAFYLAPFRAWELALGSLAALGAIAPIRSAALRELAGAAGIGMIAWSIVSLSAGSSFPGTNALYPCVGALLVIHAGASGGSNLGRLLSTRPLVLGGLMSYSLYLWHWPLLVFARYGLQRNPEGWETAAVLSASLLLSFLSWRYVESPFRRRSDDARATAFRRGRLFSGAAAAMLLATCLAVASQVYSGWPSRFEDYTPVPIRGREDYRAGSCFLEERQGFADWSKSAPCFIDHGARRTVLLWGDSFAAQYAPGLAGDARARKYNYVQFTAYACPPVPGADIPWAPNCRDINRELAAVLGRYDFAAVVVAARWERYWPLHVRKATLEDSLRLLKARGLAVVLVGQGPSFGFANPVDYVYRARREYAAAKDSTALNRELREAAGYDAFLDPHAALCPGGKCMLRDQVDYLYWDAGHYSSHGSRKMAGTLVDAVDAALAARAR